ncbi:MAG: hypothetical protein JSS14_22225 [Proteobacteria bacterium]|nr:hypothetical protein [Pseudomonadota bacterium]
MTVKASWLVTRALDSYPALVAVLNELTHADVIAALELESSTRRRHSFIERLISRAVRLNELSYKRQLQEQFHGTHPQASTRSDPGRKEGKKG